MTLQAILIFRLVTTDPARLATFYEAIGFTPGETAPITEGEMHVLGLVGLGHRQSLTLGHSRIDLDWFDNSGRPYPADANAADLVFQHLAVITDDACSAWRRALAAGATPISRDGPVELPQSVGGVTAVKFRDPDGHPLEFLQFPAGASPIWAGQGMMGADHSAISVADVGASRRFYAAHGLAEGKTSLNHGSTQVALDGLDDVRVEVVPMNPPSGPSHVELLGYRRPIGRSHPPLAANDIAATRIVWRAETMRCCVIPTGTFISLRAEVDGEKIVRGGNEEPPPVRAAKRAIGHHRRCRDETELASIRRPDVHPVRRAGPYPAARIDREAIGITMIGMAEEPSVGERAAHAHVERDDLVLRLRIVTRHFAKRERCVRHVERGARCIEREAIGLLEISHLMKIAIRRVEAINAAMIELRLGECALVRHDNPEGRIGEPYRPIGRDRDVIGRIEPLAPIVCHDRFRRVLIIATSTDAATAMFAMNERATDLNGIAVHEPCAVDQNLNTPVGIPAEQPPVRHVGPDQAVVRRLPCRAFAVESALVQFK